MVVTSAQNRLNYRPRCTSPLRIHSSPFATSQKQKEDKLPEPPGLPSSKSKIHRSRETCLETVRPEDRIARHTTLRKVITSNSDEEVTKHTVRKRYGRIGRCIRGEHSKTKLPGGKEIGLPHHLYPFMFPVRFTASSPSNTRIDVRSRKNRPDEGCLLSLSLFGGYCRGFVTCLWFPKGRSGPVRK